MENTTPLDANALLLWPKSRARELFTGTADQAKLAYRRLMHRWHPDHNPDPQAHQVFIHLQDLYQAAGSHGPAFCSVEFQDHQGRLFRFQARAEQRFALGKWYRGRGTIAFAVDPVHEALMDAYERHVRGLSYPTPAMGEQISPLLPRLHASLKGASGGFLVVRKDPEAIWLPDLVEHIQRTGQALDPRHVGWILNGLHNIACYLSHARIAHNGITPGAIWINPGNHTVQLLGGWFHSLPFGHALHSLPAEVARCAPRSCLREKIAGARLDMESIRNTGRWLLGDVSGQRMHPTTPDAMVSALRLPAPGTAVEEYHRWKQALQASFGAPKFVPLELSHHDVYPGE